MASRKPIGCWSLTVRQNHVALCSIDRMKSVMDEFAKSWCFQKEEGSTTGKLHFQCRMILPEKQLGNTMLEVFSRRGFDPRDLELQPESNNSIQQGGLSFYVMKDDTRVEGPWYDVSFKVTKRKTYEGRDLAVMDKPFDFQSFIMRSIEAEPDDRTINWVYNPGGCAGKSKLMKYLRVKGDDVARVPLGTATQIKTCVVEKGPHRTYMVDLPRVRGSDERVAELFSALEEIKNGWVESPMYGKLAELIMEPPHIWIFSNELPNTTYASKDRWKVWEIESDSIHRMSWDTVILMTRKGPAAIDNAH